MEKSGDESSGSQQVHELLLSLQPCDKVRTFEIALPKMSLCGGPLLDHDLDAGEIAAEDTRDNRIFEQQSPAGMQAFVQALCRSTGPV